ncbi:hypothetical protein [Nostoc sp. 'Lobaria pulmonaria (5183) cyanobiont']|uniref:hypothetical protein n=1 Tax=Nostoc sp. 'Lobaria pulmonaria (5183) cyanobiont' TaxID=1618022 RepID=UPI00131A1085|nr:hypothetical protein [Nostoc sp. 'Lobaria pulmonaria (5183) cyanobiont']
MMILTQVADQPEFQAIVIRTPLTLDALHQVLLSLKEKLQRSMLIATRVRLWAVAPSGLCNHKIT